jgi:hypothetical protein
VTEPARPAIHAAPTLTVPPVPEFTTPTLTPHPQAPTLAAPDLPRATPAPPIAQPRLAQMPAVSQFQPKPLASPAQPPSPLPFSPAAFPELPGLAQLPDRERYTPPAAEPRWGEMPSLESTPDRTEERELPGPTYYETKYGYGEGGGVQDTKELITAIKGLTEALKQAKPSGGERSPGIQEDGSFRPGGPSPMWSSYTPDGPVPMLRGSGPLRRMS